MNMSPRPIGRVASSREAFYYGDAIVTSTLTPANRPELDEAEVALGTYGWR